MIKKLQLTQPANSLSYLAALSDEGLMLEHLHITSGVKSVISQLENFKLAHAGVELTEAEEAWVKRAKKALEMLQQKRAATDLLLCNRRLAGRVYPDEFIRAAEETLEDGTLERISNLAASRVLAAREQAESQRLTRLEDLAESVGNR